MISVLLRRDGILIGSKATGQDDAPMEKHPDGSTVTKAKTLQEYYGGPNKERVQWVWNCSVCHKQY
jgi:hypothetical protein